MIFRFILFFLFFISCSRENNNPIAVQGFIDLGNLNLENDEAVQLKGEWEFYWDKEYTYEDFQNKKLIPDLLVKNPSPWKGLIANGKTIGNFGVATYRLKIKLNSIENELSLKAINRLARTRIFINEKLISIRGMSKIQNGNFYNSMYYSTIFKPPANEFELIIHLENKGSFFNGLLTPIYLGSINKINEVKNTIYLEEIFLFFALITLALFNIILFFVKKEKISFLWFGILGFLFAIRIGTLSEFFYLFFFQATDESFFAKFSYFSLVACIPIGSENFYQLYKQFLNRKLVNFMQAFFLLMSLYIIFTPVQVLIENANIVLGTLVFPCILFFVLIGKNLFSLPRLEAILIFIATFLLFYASVNDYLYYAGLIETKYILKYAFLFLIVAFTLISTIKVSEELAEAKNLSKLLTQNVFELNDLKNTLEQKVEERTSEVEFSKNEAIKANNAKSEFLAVMSHEIRTPLNGVIGFTDLLSKTKLNEEQNLFINKVTTCSSTLMHLLNNVLDISKIESNQLELSYESANLPKLISECFEMVQIKANEKNLNLTLDYPSQLDDFYLVDITRLKQILLNLISNAIKFTEKGSVNVKVEILESNNDETKLSFSIIDTGIGISEENKTNIFDAFNKVDSSSSRNFGGAGLGLTISNKLLFLMNSKLELESEIGFGSNFYFTLNLIKSVLTGKREIVSENLSYKNNLNKINSPNNKYTVLLVDDDSINLLLLKTVILKLKPDIKIELANEGLKAIKLANEINFDLIFMDLQMPKMDGFETVIEIRKTRKEIPILTLSADVLKSAIDKSYQVGMNEFLSKPISIANIDRALTKWLGVKV